MGSEICHISRKRRGKILLFFLSGLLSISAFARDEPKSQPAIIEVDGAAVYEKPNFDSKILNYLEKGSKVKISRKIYKGKDGFGSFYKVRLKDKRMGFIADVEVVPQLQPDFQKGNSKTASNPDFEKVEDMKHNPDPIIFTQYFGVTAGLINYSQKFSGQTKSSIYPMFGLKYTGPKLLNGPPVDFDALFGFGAPRFYSSFTDTAKGYAVLSTAMLMFEMAEYARSHLYYGMGPAVSYSSFQLTMGPQAFDSQELRMGVAVGLGFGYRIRSSVVRADFKYIWEKYRQVAFLLSFQW